MKPATITRLAADARREYWRGSLKVAIRKLDDYRARINRAVQRGKITHDDAQAAWTAGYCAADDESGAR